MSLLYFQYHVSLTNTRIKVKVIFLSKNRTEDLLRIIIDIIIMIVVLSDLIDSDLNLRVFNIKDVISVFEEFTFNRF